MNTLLVELKARLNDFEEVKRRLSLLGAQYVGSFHQVDTYFKVPQGRLKIRETEKQDNADIVFYERPNTPKIKKSHVLLFQAQPPPAAKELLTKFFATRVVVDKIREIYILGKTRIHLDQVAQLGTFIEFELSTTNEEKEIENSRSLLVGLCAKLDVRKEDLEALSYSDLMLKKVATNQKRK
jgi:predicted adenylyl cyclase CyaB